ncbi:RimJ/RimL family protein N-acetyltransferase [Kroppenstedtia sanguinis]|uniref:GNAT family N-acetyltransferase n=1 Tax=Kroppenstedtia sanguinis TaxID=1380684 RepID=A0ABW4C7K6_9BACL
MEIRVLTAEDAKAFYAHRLQMLKDHPGAFATSYEETKEEGMGQIVERLQSTGEKFTLGAFDGDRLVGSVGFLRQQRNKLRHKGFVMSMYTHPDIRRQGVGKALLENLLARVRKLPSLEQIQLGVAVDNSAARGLYASLGFEEFGREREALKLPNRYVDEIHMVLKLKR